MTRLTPDELAAVRMERELLLAELRRLDAMIASQPARGEDEYSTVRMLPVGKPIPPPRPLPPGLSLRAAAAIADLIESDRIPAEDPDSVTGDENTGGER